jgi:hypothetical protein
VAEPLEKFESGDADFRKEGIDIAGNEESDSHEPILSNGV